jgi:hypothetical protein
MAMDVDEGTTEKGNGKHTHSAAASQHTSTHEGGHRHGNGHAGHAAEDSHSEAHNGALMTDLFGHYADGPSSHKAAPRYAGRPGRTQIDPGLAHDGAEYDGDGAKQSAFAAPPTSTVRASITEYGRDGKTLKIVIGALKHAKHFMGASGRMVTASGRTVQKFYVLRVEKNGEARAELEDVSLDQAEANKHVEVEAHTADGNVAANTSDGGGYGQPSGQAS